MSLSTAQHRAAWPSGHHLAHALACASLCLTFAAPASAQPAWPDRPPQLIVPFPAGGAPDVVARAFAERMAGEIGRPLVIINRDGASGTIGTAQVAAARPDGYVLGFVTFGPLAIQPHLMKDLPYKPDAFIPICQAFANQSVLAAAPNSAIASLADLLAAAKARPGKVPLGFGGVGTLPHLLMVQFIQAAGLDVLQVPFRADPAAIVGLRGGEVDAVVVNLGLARAQGLRVLATFAEERQTEFPNAPTLREAGFNASGSVYGGLVAPRGTADEIVRRLEAACEKTVADERYRASLRSAGQQPVYRGAAAFAKALAQDYETMREVVRAAKIPVN
ncbi:MAG: tripartite tricarboxylate transporter substrate binding protein [Burkholderiales bacterium]|nr:tripartite tricarboxylate transporter substrate binding protein [Burkholderiales bacterium]